MTTSLFSKRMPRSTVTKGTEGGLGGFLDIWEAVNRLHQRFNAMVGAQLQQRVISLDFDMYSTM